MEPGTVVSRFAKSVEKGNDPFEAAVIAAANTVPHEELPYKTAKNGNKYKTTSTQQVSGDPVEMDGQKFRRQITFNVNYWPMASEDGGSGRKEKRSLKTIEKVEGNISPESRKALAQKWLSELGVEDENEG